MEMTEQSKKQLKVMKDCQINGYKNALVGFISIFGARYAVGYYRQEGKKAIATSFALAFALAGGIGAYTTYSCIRKHNSRLVDTNTSNTV